MKIKGTEVQATTQDINFDLKGTYKEPLLTFTLDGTEIFKVAIDASTVQSASGANDTLVFQVSLSGADGVAETLARQVHIPTFKATYAPDLNGEPAPTETIDVAEPVTDAKA